MGCAAMCEYLSHTLLLTSACSFRDTGLALLLTNFSGKEFIEPSAWEQCLQQAARRSARSCQFGVWGD